MPLIHKKLTKITPPEVDCGIRMSRLHIGVLSMLAESSPPISEIAGAFIVPNSQMTHLIDQLVGAGLVERTKDPLDRRVKVIVLSARGREVFRQCDAHLRENMKNMLSDLSEKELMDLSESLIKLRKIGPKLGPH